jgi:UDP-N-acetylmuramate--alanine ligase
VIGGKLQAAGAHSRLGSGEHIVVEADESDASFLHLSPVISVVTNIDADHMETYGHSLVRLHAAFADFIARLPFYGRAIVCVEDAGVRAVLPRLQRATTRYGFGAEADLRAVHVQVAAGGRMTFIAQQTGYADLSLTLNLAGEHNVLNALAALAVSRELGLADSAAAEAFKQFAGVGRRFERYGDIATVDGGHCTLIDDYGHHPVELAAVLAAARGAFATRRLVLAFQPHRYSRTRDCFQDFARVLRQADVVLITEVYAAGEPPIAGADGRALAHAVGCAFAQNLADLQRAITRTVQDGDVLITCGAGSIGDLPAQLMGTRMTDSNATITLGAAA